jgi:hypothetical protein
MRSTLRIQLSFSKNPVSCHIIPVDTRDTQIPGIHGASHSRTEKPVRGGEEVCELRRSIFTQACVASAGKSCHKPAAPDAACVGATRKLGAFFSLGLHPSCTPSPGHRGDSDPIREREKREHLLPRCDRRLRRPLLGCARARECMTGRSLEPLLGGVWAGNASVEARRASSILFPPTAGPKTHARAHAVVAPSSPCTQAPCGHHPRARRHISWGRSFSLCCK